MNIPCLYNRVVCAINSSGVLSKITFLRINIEESEEVDEFFGEREVKKKKYDGYVRNAVVEENPRQNIIGATGGQKIADLRVLLYDQTFIPKNSDKINWRGEIYDITEVERISPFGTNSQLGYDIMAEHRG